MPVLLALLALSLIEIALFVLIGGWIGLGPTLVLVLAGIFLGGWIIRTQGFRTAAQVQRAMAGMRDPALPVADTALVMAAGFLFILPGFFTDLVGALLLVPPLRRALIRAVGRRMTGTGRTETRFEVIEGEFEVIDEPARPRSGHRDPSDRTGS